jgi:putative flippase GtrA
MNIGSVAGAIAARFTFLRYLLASLCALSGDMLLFLALLRLEMPPAAAGAVGYVGGLLLHWLISVRFVFTSVRKPTHGQRLGFAGLAPALAKLFAIPVSFLSVYAIRKYGVFAAS